MEHRRHVIAAIAWTKLTTESLQARFAALGRRIAAPNSSADRLAHAARHIPGLAGYSRRLRSIIAGVYAIYAHRASAMANVDLGGQYKRIVRFFWDPEPENDDPEAAPIWCLGQVYSNPPTRHPRTDTKGALSSQVAMQEDDADRDTVLISRPPPESTHESPPDSDPSAAPTDDDLIGGTRWPEPFLDDFESRFWFTYRSHFPAIKKSVDPKAVSSLSLGVRLRSQLVDQNGFTADTGWGCMIRSGQCVLANALAISSLGRDWRRGSKASEERRLVSLFADDPRAPYSLHRFVQHGEAACGKYPGEWFGPSATARCIEALATQHAASGIKVYVTGDGADVYEDRFLRLATNSGTGFQPVLLLVGTRLGIDRVNPVYWDALRHVLQLPQSLGIAGGRPSASHYFVGVQGDQFFYLDPHQTRPLLPYHEEPAKYTSEEIDSCHTRRLRRLHMEAMDPSMLIAFLIKDREDWTQWKEAMSQTQGKPVLHLADHAPPHGRGAERAEAIDEVEILDEEDELQNGSDHPPESR